MRQKNHEVEIRFEERLPECSVRTDRQRIMQVINNFLNNAMKFTPAEASGSATGPTKGTSSISTSATRDAASRLKTTTKFSVASSNSIRSSRAADSGFRL